MLYKRNLLTNDEIYKASNIISNKICLMSEYKNADTILFYYPFKKEVDLLDLIKSALGSKKVCLPYMKNTSRTMTAREITSIENLKIGKYSIYAPSKNAKIIDTDNIDFIIVPIIAFDDNLHRIGYGGGYYDKFFVKCENAYKCGAAYAFQKIEPIKSGRYDIALDKIVTEQ